MGCTSIKDQGEDTPGDGTGENNDNKRMSQYRRGSDAFGTDSFMTADEISDDEEYDLSTIDFTETIRGDKTDQNDDNEEVHWHMPRIHENEEIETKLLDAREHFHQQFPVLGGTDLNNKYSLQKTLVGNSSKSAPGLQVWCAKVPSTPQTYSPSTAYPHVPHGRYLRAKKAVGYIAGPQSLNFPSA